MLNNDPRPQFPFAFAVARRWAGWLEEEYPQDFRQAVSLACCVEQEKGKALARAVQREMYRLARQHGYYRPAVGLRRGTTGRWHKPDAQLRPTGDREA